VLAVVQRRVWSDLAVGHAVEDGQAIFPIYLGRALLAFGFVVCNARKEQQRFLSMLLFKIYKIQELISFLTAERLLTL
jgi:hypothetical protein